MLMSRKRDRIPWKEGDIVLAANKLKGKIVERGLSTEEVANALKLHRSTFYRKLQGAYPFTINEADRLVEILHLSREEASAIFFSQIVA